LASNTPAATSACAQCRPPRSGAVRPCRTPAAAVVWSCGSSPANTCPTSKSATSGWPRFTLRATAWTSPGNRLGRMSDSASAIGLASLSAGAPPPKARASRCAMNDHVTASTMPRAASARRAVAMRVCRVVRTLRVTGAGRGSAVSATSSMPTMRTTSSTRSALPSTSCRHVGVVTRHGSADRSTSKPSAPSTRSDVSRATSIPDSRNTSPGGKLIVRRPCGTVPATSTGPARPPQSSRIIRVAISSPGTMNAGSTPRSKR